MPTNSQDGHQKWLKHWKEEYDLKQALAEMLHDYGIDDEEVEDIASYLVVAIETYDRQRDAQHKARLLEVIKDEDLRGYRIRLNDESFEAYESRVATRNSVRADLRQAIEQEFEVKDV